MIAATNGHVLGFDNLSDLSDWLSDAICRLSTGGGFTTRALYTDDEEQIFDAVRPIVLNGIPDFASRQDLVSRSVFVTLPPIPESRRRDESTFWAEFEQARPQVLGALLDAVSIALRNELTVQLDRLPRMADFAKWVVAAEPALPWEPGTFIKVYAGNRADAIEATLDGDPLADLVKGFGKWSGIATDLLTALNDKTDEATRNKKDWYKQPRQVADALRRLAPALRQVDINVDFVKEKGSKNRRRIIEIENKGGAASAASASSAGPETQGKSADASSTTSSTTASVSSATTSRPESADAARTQRGRYRPARTQIQDAADAADAVDPTQSFGQGTSVGAPNKTVPESDISNREKDVWLDF
jgi:hypothetical protein